MTTFLNFLSQGHYPITFVPERWASVCIILAGRSTKEKADRKPEKSVDIKTYTPYPYMKWILERKSGAKQSTRQMQQPELLPILPIGIGMHVPHTTVPERESKNARLDTSGRRMNVLQNQLNCFSSAYLTGQ